MKCIVDIEQSTSLLSRGAWIEICNKTIDDCVNNRRSSHEERGLKFSRPITLMLSDSRSSHEERGLKFPFGYAVKMSSKVAPLTRSVD